MNYKTNEKGLLWVRKDVRLHDNPALIAALESGVNTAVFISTPEQWQRHHQAPIKIDFLRRHLVQYSTQLQKLGIRLIHLKASTYADQVFTLIDFCSSYQAQKVFANRELELDESNRDASVLAQSIDLTLFDSETIVPLGEVLNQQGKMYKVFTPYKNTWLAKVKAHGIKCLSLPTGLVKELDLATEARELPTDIINSFDFDYPMQDSIHWALSEEIISNMLPSFFEKGLLRYGADRDIPSIEGTSKLSPYLAIGAISPRWLAAQLIQRDPEIIYDQKHLAFPWLNELIWRDFYKDLLSHCPDLIKGNSFQEKYQHLPWRKSESDFNAWCEGKTGYPIVDAAMRQLLQTGWMHNRLRMVVASFLTKHLLIDWRWGERFFMAHLIDGDSSANNGGWQWAASTGCDAQPYFRIFNPITQGKKFDPKGEFVRRYVPELSDVPDKEIHFPHDYLSSIGKADIYYPALVEHTFARTRAMEFFR